MPYVKRNKSGEIIAVSQDVDGECNEELSSQDAELNTFVASVSNSGLGLEDTDLSFVRVVEDVIELLIAKNLILFTELPDSAQTKMMDRQKLRTALTSHLDLLEDDENFI